MNNLLKGLKQETNLTFTENHAITYKSTLSGIMDLFALGGAYRSRSDEDCILLFKNAFDVNETLALKCLFYLRDARGGQGERRFWRVCMKWLANKHTEAARRNLPYVSEFGRWDDLYVFVNTPLEAEAFKIIKHQLALDVECKTPSLLAKWLKSENASSKETKRLGAITRQYLNMTSREYRLTLSILRERINVLERLMSAGKWDEIEFDKIPSKAGLIYRNAFARRDIIAKKYESFMKDEKTKVNAGTLYPYEVVEKALCSGSRWSYNFYSLDDVERAAINKYWDNLTDYFNGASLDALCVIDTSGSMMGTPMNVAVSLGMYAAERARGPFAGYYVSFASRPQLIKVDGIDFVDKVRRIAETNLCDNTNIEATFDLLLNTARKTHCTQEDLPKKLVIISDMEFDQARGYSYWHKSTTPTKSLIEGIEEKWNAAGYKMPKLVFWCVDARQDNIPMQVKDGVTFISGFSPVLFEQIMQNKGAWDLILDKLNSERYSVIR